MSSDRSPVDFGRKLREARERRGTSLRAIAEATKISVAALEALERNDVSRLPGGIFSRAFVRAYAANVGLDPEATIQEFVAAFPGESSTAGHSTAPTLDEAMQFEQDRRTAKLVLRGGAAAVVIVAGLAYVFATIRRSPTAEVTPQPAAAAAEPAPAPVTPQPQTEAQAPPAQAPAASDSRAAAPAPAQNVEAPSVPASDSLQIGVSARRPCWVSATVDGRKAIEQLLQVGDERTVDVHRELVLTAGDAAAIALTVNGAAARPLGKSGEVVTVRLNANNFKDYLLSR